MKPGLGQAHEGSSCPRRDTHDIMIWLPWRSDRRHIEVSTTHSIVLRVHLLEVLPRDRECANCILLHLSLSGSVYAVQQFGRRCQTPGPGYKKGYLPRYLLGMRGRADGRVGSLRGTWRSFHLLGGMGRPTGRSMPGKKTSCGTGRPGGVQRNPCAKPSKMNGICLGLACSGTQGPPEASGVPEPARRVPQNRAMR